jgi:ABC-2 type transport system permease protein
MALGLGILYSMLFQMKIETFLPYVTAGFIVWGLIVGCVTEGTDTFITNEGLIKHLPAPITVYVLRTVWRQLLMFAHNLIIYVIVLVIFFDTLSSPYYMSVEAVGHHHPGIGASVLLGIPGLALLALNGVWVAMLFGIISTRYRDIPQVINSLIQLVFYMTPIVWSPDILGRVGRDIGQIAVQLNPLYHYVQIVRGPMLGQTVDWWSWVIVIGITMIGWALALLAMRNYRARVSYWV